MNVQQHMNGGSLIGKNEHTNYYINNKSKSLQTKMHSCATSLLIQPRVEAKPETQTAPLRPRDQRTRDRPAFTQRGPRPGNSHSPD